MVLLYWFVYALLSRCFSIQTVSIFIMSNDSNLVCVRIGICILIFDLFFSAHYEELLKKYLCLYIQKIAQHVIKRKSPD